MSRIPPYHLVTIAHLPLPSLFGGASRWIISLALCFTLGSALGAPYPKEGLLTEWVQPDGTRLILRVFGDEFYARTTTDDGYTVIFQPADKTYYYAIVGPDGKSLIPSKVEAGKEPPKMLPKHLKEPPETVAAKRAKNVEKYAPDRSEDWAARKKAVRDARAREAEANATLSDPLQPPGEPTNNSEASLE